MALDIKYQRPTYAEIDIRALVHNLNEAKRLAGSKSQILAIVKADAYGHGAVTISEALVRNGIQYLGTALVEEAVELRDAGIKIPIIVLGGIFKEQIPKIAEYDLTPVVYQEGFLKAIANEAGNINRQINIHIKIDTGMGRIGVLPEDAVDFVKKAASQKNIKVEGVMTHFADADLADKAYAEKQMAEFTSIVNKINKEGIDMPYQHISNSAALIGFENNKFNMARPGIMLYGYAPFSKGKEWGLNLIPVMSLKTKILHLKRVLAGAYISYGRTFVAKRESIIATLPIGYADGYSRALSNKGSVIVKGKKAPIAGRVCMDMTMIDVTDIDGVDVNDEVVLIGKQGKETITADDIAMLTNTISYEVLCCVGKRVPRVYING
ncbi:MAG: alanine racemase [Nitrospirota bacterium]